MVSMAHAKVWVASLAGSDEVFLSWPTLASQRCALC